MKVKLTHRHFGIHETRAEAEIPGEFSDYAQPAEPGNEHRDEWVIDEDKLIAALPADPPLFVVVKTESRRILLGVEDEFGGTAHSGTTRFRRWAKYFDAYMLWLVKPDEVATDGN